MEPNQAQGTVAEVRRLVGRDWRMGASLIASLPIASAPLARALGRAFGSRGMSLAGTFRTCRDSLTMSAHRGKADIPPQGRDFRF